MKGRIRENIGRSPCDFYKKQYIFFNVEMVSGKETRAAITPHELQSNPQRSSVAINFPDLCYSHQLSPNAYCVLQELFSTVPLNFLSEVSSSFLMLCQSEPPPEQSTLHISFVGGLQMPFSALKLSYYDTTQFS